jgi:hypothetical protein
MGLFRRRAVPENVEGMEPVVRALCLLAASVHGKQPNEQQDVAECYFAWCMEGETEIVLDDALINSISRSLRLDPSRIRREGPKRS